MFAPFAIHRSHYKKIQKLVLTTKEYPFTNPTNRVVLRWWNAPRQTLDPLFCVGSRHQSSWDAIWRFWEFLQKYLRNDFTLDIVTTQPLVGDIVLEDLGAGVKYTIQHKYSEDKSNVHIASAPWFGQKDY
jgi:hypothetical protein